MTPKYPETQFSRSGCHGDPDPPITDKFSVIAACGAALGQLVHARDRHAAAVASQVRRKARPCPVEPPRAGRFRCHHSRRLPRAPHAVLALAATVLIRTAKEEPAM